MIAIWYKPSQRRYGSICVLYDIFGRCVQTESAVRLQKLFCYIRHGKINYKLYFFILYDKEYLHPFWSFATHVHFRVRQAVADTPFFTTIILKNYKICTILVELN
jgi:hypothetical protein